jgi:hypothetical protein
MILRVGVWTDEKGRASTLEMDQQEWSQFALSPANSPGESGLVCDGALAIPNQNLAP